MPELLLRLAHAPHHRALVRVAPGEAADIEAIGALVAPNAPILALQCHLVATGELPADVLEKVRNGTLDVPYQYGLPRLEHIAEHARVYDVRVST